MTLSDTETNTDMEHFQSYLSTHLDVHVVETEILNVGLNRIIRIGTPENPNEYVVRQPTSARTDSGFIDAATEFKVMERLESTDVPAPNAIHFCADESVLGTPFSVIEFVEGAGIHWGESLPPGQQTPRARERLGTLLVDTLTHLHTVDVDQFDDICERVRPTEQVAQTLAQLEDATNATEHDCESLWWVADWLEQNTPERSATALVHGDYKPDNVFWTWPDGPRVSAVVDWETAMIRDPRTELGNLLFYWCAATDPSPSIDEFADRHSDAVIAELRKRDQRGFWSFTSEPGSVGRHDLVSRWERTTGLEYDNDRFYRSFSAFMLATVWEGLYADALEHGEDSSDWEAHIEYVARLARMIATGEVPL